MADAVRSSIDVREIIPGDHDYPQGLVQNDRRWESLHTIGNSDILKHSSVGLICSVQCPGSIVIKTFDAIRELRDAGVVVAGGFHSPMEKECLDFLLRGKQPVIVCSAKGFANPRLPATWREAIEADRLLVVSTFADKVRRTTKAQAQIRNEFVAALASAVFVPHASPGGKAEAVAREVAASGKPLYTFDDPENKSLKGLSVRCYNVAEIRSLLCRNLTETPNT